MGSPGVDSMKWLRPVRPGDTLSGRSVVLEFAASKSRPDRGFVRFRHEVANDRGEPVMVGENPIMFQRRGRMIFFEDIARSARASELGAHTFTAEEIKRFASAFDPQPFHTDEAAAAASHFGGLCASGWHTIAVWMKLNVRRMQALAERTRRRRPSARAARPLARLRGAEMAEAGLRRRHGSATRPRSSPSARAARGPAGGSSPSGACGRNQAGEDVISFVGHVFVEMRDKLPAEPE